MNSTTFDHRPTRTLNRVVCLLIAFLILYGLVFSWQSWRDEKAEQVGELMNIIELSEKGIDTFLTQLENSMRGLSRDLNETKEQIPLERAFVLVKRFKELHPELVNVTFIREDGEILLTAATPPGPSLPTLALEPSFLKFREELQNGNPLSIGQPLMSLIGKEWIIPLRYGIKNEGGKLKYIISANLPVGILERFWKDAPFTGKAALGLMRDDGFLVSRYPVPANLQLAEIYGKPRTGILIEHLKQEGFPRTGSVVGVSSLDGPDHLNVFHRLEHFPINLFIAMRMSEIRAGWWEKVRVPYILSAILFLGGAFFYRLTLHRERIREMERRQASEVLQESEEKYRVLFHNELYAICIFDLETLLFLDINPAYTKLYGYSRDELLGGMTIHDITAQHQESDEATQRAIVSGTTHIPLRFHRKKDGTVFPVDIVGGPYTWSGRKVMFALARDVTDRRQAEMALLESKRAYDEMVARIPVGIYKIRIKSEGDTVFDYVSPRFLEMLALECDDVLRNPKIVFDLVHPEDLQRLVDTTEAARKMEGPFRWEGRLVVNGQVRFMRMESLPQRLDNGDIIWTGTQQDVTERRQAMEAVEESERKYRRLFEVESDALFLIEEDTLKILDVNASCEALYGYGRDELLRMCSLEVSAEPEKTGHAIKEEVGHVAVRWHRKKDGTVFPVEITGTYFDLAGKRVHLAAVRDVSIRMQTEQSLRESEERWQFALEGSGDGVWDWNVQTNEVYFSKQWKAMLGFEDHEIAATLDEWDRRVHPDDLQRVCAEINRHLEGETPVYQSEHRVRCKDGSYKWILDRGKVIGWSNEGKPARMIGTHTDMTARREAEEERLEFEQRLRHMQKVESLATMAGAIAHHFNNMLGVVIGNLELALDELPQGSELQRGIAEAMKASHRATEVSRFMLTYLGQTTGKTELLDLAEAVMDTCALLDVSMPKNVKLKTEFPSGKPIIRADGVQLKQVLTNLISNAVEAIGEKEGSVTLNIHVMETAKIQKNKLLPLDWEPKSENCACISVSDTGCGLEEASRERIFDPFFTTKFTGRGLGLAVVLGLVRAHNGAIGVEGEPGPGATFRVFLPLPAQQQLPDREADAIAVGPFEDECLVLVVDDEEIVRHMAESMLRRKFGCEVISASTGSGALEIFRVRGNEIGLVLLDLNMQGMDGWQTLAGLRALRANIPVILVSGFDEAQVMGESREERPQAFLHKPYMAEDLKAAIVAARKR